MDSIIGLDYTQRFINLGITHTRVLNNTLNFIRKHVDPEVWDTLQDVTVWTLPDAFPLEKGERLEGYTIIDIKKFNKFKILLRAIISTEVLQEVRDHYQFDIDLINFK